MSIGIVTRQHRNALVTRHGVPVSFVPLISILRPRIVADHGRFLLTFVNVWITQTGFGANACFIRFKGRFSGQEGRLV